MQAVAVLDSLLSQMPFNELNVTSARQEVLNDINNSYPSFRQIANFVSSYRRNGYKEDPRSSMARIVPSLTSADMMAFYKANIQRQPRAVFIIGSKRHMDLQQLARYGRVVELKKSDIMR